jgi:hypothetical protein
MPMPMPMPIQHSITRPTAKAVIDAMKTQAWNAVWWLP